MSTETTALTMSEAQGLLGPNPVAAVAGDKPAHAGSVTTARVIRRKGTQIEPRPMDLESLLP
jgi:hypothetical protein